MNSCELSLIIGYVERSICLDSLLCSLTRQTFHSFEVIIIDQSADNHAREMGDKYWGYYPITVVHAFPAKGVSRARNIGLNNAKGRWCAFPDDDCIYPDNLLKNIGTWLNSHAEYCGLSCLVTDCNNHFSAGGYMSRKECDISQRNIWRTVVSPSLFLKTKDVLAIQRFDERLGIGVESKWGGGEETEMVLRLVKAGFKIHYCPQFKVIHPRYQGSYDLDRITYGWRCGCGCGAVMKIHQFGSLISIYYATLQFFRGIQQLLLFRARRAVFHFAMGTGRLFGRFAFRC